MLSVTRGGNKKIGEQEGAVGTRVSVNKMCVCESVCVCACVCVCVFAFASFFISPNDNIHMAEGKIPCLPYCECLSQEKEVKKG